MVQEAKNLVALMGQESLSGEERFAVWMLLSEFHRMFQAFVPKQRNHIIMWMANEFNYTHYLHHPTWMVFMLVPAEAAAINPQNMC